MPQSGSNSYQEARTNLQDKNEKTKEINKPQLVAKMQKYEADMRDPPKKVKPTNVKQKDAPHPKHQMTQKSSETSTRKMLK